MSWQWVPTLFIESDGIARESDGNFRHSINIPEYLYVCCIVWIVALQNSLRYRQEIRQSLRKLCTYTKGRISKDVGVRSYPPLCPTFSIPMQLTTRPEPLSTPLHLAGSFTRVQDCGDVRQWGLTTAEDIYPCLSRILPHLWLLLFASTQSSRIIAHCKTSLYGLFNLKQYSL
jgi:hypothetical protein